uniref:Uncharacterized protein n=1 Tax=Mustela putorius furo TaxID=9669 RepID=M3Z4J8_MUSPF
MRAWAKDAKRSRENPSKKETQRQQARGWPSPGWEVGQETHLCARRACRGQGSSREGRGSSSSFWAASAMAWIFLSPSSSSSSDAPHGRTPGPRYRRVAALGSSFSTEERDGPGAGQQGLGGRRSPSFRSLLPQTNSPDPQHLLPQTLESRPPAPPPSDPGVQTPSPSSLRPGSLGLVPRKHPNVGPLGPYYLRTEKPTLQLPFKAYSVFELGPPPLRLESAPPESSPGPPSSGSPLSQNYQESKSLPLLPSGPWSSGLLSLPPSGFPPWGWVLPPPTPAPALAPRGTGHPPEESRASGSHIGHSSTAPGETASVSSGQPGGDYPREGRDWGRSVPGHQVAGGGEYHQDDGCSGRSPGNGNPLMPVCLLGAEPITLHPGEPHTYDHPQTHIRSL